jgi:excisionase family DNA binding protein
MIGMSNIMSDEPKSSILRNAMKSGPQPLGAREVFTVPEACDYLRISKWTLYRLMNSHKLKTLKIGTRRLIRRDALETLMETLETEGRM